MNHAINFPHTEEFTIGLVDLVEEFLFDLNPNLRYVFKKHKSDLVFSAPQIVIDMLALGFSIKYRSHFFNPAEKSTALPAMLNGVKIVPGHEMAILLYHKDFPVIQEPWMIKKVMLQYPSHQPNEVYTQHTISLLKVLFPESNGTLN